MKIWGGIPKILGVYDKQKSLGKVGRSSGISAKKDVVSISNAAKDYQVAVKALKDVPDVRQDKVNELIQKFESGSYDVSGKEVADKVLKSILDRKV